MDFAGSDTEKRPRDFEDIIKYLRDKGIDNLTYHIGENCYDLVDGVRALDELMTDLNWQKPNRLAHLLALFTNADKYYERKHYTVTMPRKMLLDNLEWIRKNAPEGVDTNDFVLPDILQQDEDIVVFGDGMNDICMFGQGWLSIAMGNARAALKEKADYITTDVDKDGLWNACRHFGWI